jgi:hypothetical protein
VQADERVQDQQSWSEGGEGSVQSQAIVLLVEAEAGGDEQVQVEWVKCKSSVVAEVPDALADGGGVILGEVDEDGSW